MPDVYYEAKGLHEYLLNANHSDRELILEALESKVEDLMKLIKKREKNPSKDELEKASQAYCKKNLARYKKLCREFDTDTKDQ